MTISLVGTPQGAQGNSATASAQKTGCTSGNLLVVICREYNATARSSSNASSTNETWSQDHSIDDAAGSQKIRIFSAKCLTNGTVTVNVPCNNGSSWWGISIHEYSGVDTGAARYLTGNTATGNSSSASSGSITPAGNALYVATVTHSNGDTAIAVTGTGWNQALEIESTSAGQPFNDAYKSGSGAQQNTWSFNPTNPWLGAIVAYAEASTSVSGSGAITADAAVAAGAGDVDVSGTGALTGADATAAGAGDLDVSGAGAITAADAVAAGAGEASDSRNASGAITTDAAVADGAVDVDASGAGAPTGADATADGAGDADISGTGAVTGAAATAAGTGTAGSGGNVINAASAEYSDVVAAIASATAGDIVQIPAGTATWASSLVLNKAIHLRGAGSSRIHGHSASAIAVGTGSKTFTIANGDDWQAGDAIVAVCPNASGNTMTGTVTSNSAGSLVINVASVTGSSTHNMWVFRKTGQTVITLDTGGDFAVTEQAGGHVEVSNFDVLRGTSTVGFWQVGGSLSTKPLIVHDMHFQSSTSDIFDFTSTVHSLSYRNSFVSAWSSPGNTIRTASCFRFKNTGDDVSWTTASTLGSNSNGQDQHFVEDSFFLWFSTECCDFDDNSRVVWRYNTMHHSGLTSHGQDTSQDGVRHFELYNNRWVYDNNQLSSLLPNMDYQFYIRGGSGVITDNIIDDISNSEWGNKTEIRMTIQALRRNAGINACYAGSYPCPRQIGQGHNGTTTVTEGLYVWNNTGGYQIAGEDYSPDECGGGPSVATFLQLDRDYFLSAKSGYTKFTYPHPLREAGTGEISGSGALTADAATPAGTGTVEVAGAGSVTADGAAASGFGDIDVSGSGAITGDAAVAAGTGTASDSRNASGAITTDAAVADGTGDVDVSGAGALTGADATADGEGDIDVSSTGAITGDAAVAAGTGTVGDSRNASGAITTDAAVADGTGDVDASGAGALTGADATADGSGDIDVSSTSAITGDAASASGAGDIDVSGAGAIAGNAAVASGVGTARDARNATGAITADNAEAVGAGTVEIAGTVALTADAAAASGSGDSDVSGSAAIITDAAANGDGDVIVYGAGAVTASDAAANASVSFIILHIQGQPGLLRAEPRRGLRRVD